MMVEKHTMIRTRMRVYSTFKMGMMAEEDDDEWGGNALFRSLGWDGRFMCYVITGELCISIHSQEKEVHFIMMSRSRWGV